MFYRMYLSSVCNRRQWPEPIYEPFTTRQGHFCKVRVNNREYSTDVPYSSADLAQDAAATKAFMICRDFSKNDGRMPGQRPGQSSAPNGVVQGLPVAIGTGRRGVVRRSTYGSSDSSEGSSDGALLDVLSLLDTSSSPSSSLGSGSNESVSPNGLNPPFEHQILPRRQPQQAISPRHQHQQHHHYQHQHHPQTPPGLLPRRGTNQGFSRGPAPAMPYAAGNSPLFHQPGNTAQYVCSCRRARVRANGRCDLCLREGGWLPI